MKTYTLLDLCRIIENSLDGTLDSSYLLTAEISGLQVRNGHCYMELVEKSQANGIYDAKMRATCWAHKYNMLSAYFQHETGQTLKNGMQVLVEVEVSFHSVYGMSLNIIDIDPKYTLGDLARTRQQTIDKLKQEGIFDLNKSLSLPSLPQHIAVISSADAAGYSDFKTQLLNNSQGYAFSVTLFQAIMQGDNAAQSICNALEQIAQNEHLYDLVIITRGGGSSNDLTCFDDYTLCAYCAQFPLPVITAIGHTKDVSIADEVAYLSLKTPTAAAAYLIEKLDFENARLADLEHRLHLAIRNINTAKLQKINNLQNRISTLFQQHLIQYNNKLEIIEKTINLHSPKHILDLGYTITLVDGQPIKSTQNIVRGTLLVTETANGKLTSIVE